MNARLLPPVPPRSAYLPPARGRGDRYLDFLSWVLFGYAIGDKGFAYLGAPPVFIGEASLAAGIVVALLNRRMLLVARSPTIHLLGLFIAWGALRTIPYWRVYGMDALRDGMLWGYSLFAIVVAALLIAKPARLVTLVRRYRHFVPVFVCTLPIVWIATAFLGDRGPHWPGSGAPILFAKANDLLVHLGGVTAFVALGLFGRTSGWMSAALIVDVLLIGYVTRGGLLAFTIAVGISFVFKPLNRISWQLFGFAAGLVSLLALSGLTIRLGDYRELSFNQFAGHLTSTAGESADAGLEDTKLWRLAWWASIVDYTILGEHFWAGKGYGVNLADDDGFQVAADGSLRSPHNVHLTVLARSGVIGAGLWFALLVSWAITLGRAIASSRHKGYYRWSAFFVFILAYWLAALVCATFDVYLEGPMGGIWFWVLMGVGIGATEVYRRSAVPDLLSNGAAS